jgi:hypothetical protein
MHNQSSQLDKTRQPTANLTCNRAGGSYAQPLHWDSFHSNRVCLPWDFAPSRPDERLLHGHKLSVSFGLHAPTLEQHLTTLFSKNYTPLEITRSISHKLLVPERRHGGATFTRRFRPAGITSECVPLSPDKAIQQDTQIRLLGPIRFSLARKKQSVRNLPSYPETSCWHPPFTKVMRICYSVPIYRRLIDEARAFPR